MGLGLLGRGVGDVRFLAEEGAELIVTDIKTSEQLAASLHELSREKIGESADRIRYVLGGHRLEDFKNRDFILKAAGVPLDSIYIAEARKHNIPVEMSTSLFAALSAATIVGITGTRGKSTVTHLLYEILKRAYESKNNRIFLGGNVRGVATLPFLRDTRPSDIAVLELDSWQLQGFGERKISPHISIFTTFYPDHLNYYKNNLDSYLNDKANIFKFQTADDALVVGDQATSFLEEKYSDVFSQTQVKKIVVGGNGVPKDWQLKILGDHNRYNVALAIAAARALNVPESCIKDVCEHFSGVPGRLEYLGEKKGVKIYNDTTATTPDATIAALRALNSLKVLDQKKGSTILIFGGADKQLDMHNLLQEIKNSVQSTVLLNGTGSEKILPSLQKIFGTNLHQAGSMKEAVEQAFGLAKAGDTIILSPAFSSFGMFKNEFDRGDQFVKVVEKIYQL